MKINVYYMVEEETCKYGGYETFEAAKRYSDNNGRVKRITKVIELEEVVYEKPDWSITKEEVMNELEHTLEYDPIENSYLSKDAIQFLIKYLEDHEEDDKVKYLEQKM